MNQTVTNQTSLEDFEEFDLRDAINVAVYGFMSVGKLASGQWRLRIIDRGLNYNCLLSWDGTQWSRPGYCSQTLSKVLAKTVF